MPAERCGPWSSWPSGACRHHSLRTASTLTRGRCAGCLAQLLEDEYVHGHRRRSAYLRADDATGRARPARSSTARRWRVADGRTSRLRRNGPARPLISWFPATTRCSVSLTAAVPTRRSVRACVSSCRRIAPPAARCCWRGATAGGRVFSTALSSESRAARSPTPGSLRKELDLVRREGYATEDGELQPKVRAVAAAVRTGGDVVAALSVSGGRFGLAASHAAGDPARGRAERRPERDRAGTEPMIRTRSRGSGTLFSAQTYPTSGRAVSVKRHSPYGAQGADDFDG